MPLGCKGKSLSLSLNLENQEESQRWERMATRNVILPPTLEGGKTCVVEVGDYLGQRALVHLLVGDSRRTL